MTFGDYPFSMRALVGDRLPKFTPEESLKLIDSFDFIGLNYYTSRYAKHVPYNYNDKLETSDDDPHVKILVKRAGVPIGPAEPQSWVNVYPKGLKKLLLHIKKRYNNPPIYITENGVFESTNDKSKSTPTDDIYRSEYHTSHLHELEHALSNNVDVKGYFVWSLFDSFEWNSGYTARFGLIYIDNDNLHGPDLRRIPKESARWLKRHLRIIKDQQVVPVPLLKEEVAAPVTASISNP